MDKELFWKELKSGKFVSMVKESSFGKEVSCSIEVYNILNPLFAEEDDVESTYFIFLNHKLKILAIENVFKGSISNSVIYPREVVKKLIGHKANAFIMAHNHPSGDTHPSAEDRSITFQLMVAVYSIGANFLDHIIVGNGFYSMGDEGIIQTMREKVNNFMKGIQ